MFTKNKYKLKSLFTAKDYWNYCQKQNAKKVPIVPPNIIISYQKDVLLAVVKENKGQYSKELGTTLYFLKDTKKQIGLVGGFGIGGAAVAVLMEELIALGAKQFLAIGYAGSLQTKLAIGDSVLCSKAVRGEGVSRHYLSESEYSYPNKELNNVIISTAKRLNISLTTGSTWTTDVIYRETKSEIKYYQDTGTATVDMEAATIFAVAKYHHVKASAIFTISDYCGLEKWEPHFSQTVKPLNKLLLLAKKGLMQSK
jgi:uridine phosphorylase